MWHQWLGVLMTRIGRQMAAVGAAIAGVVLLIVGHRRAVSKAERSGRTEGEQAERERIERETDKQELEIRGQAHEIRQDYADLDRDELRRRMREQARPRD